MAALAQHLKPKFIGVDHVSWTVPDIEAAVRFYVDVFDAQVVYRLGPIDAADLPVDEHGRDWMDTHVNVPGACVLIAMLKLSANLNFELFEYSKPDDRSAALPRNCDRGGHHIAIRVDDVDQAAAYLSANGCRVLETIVMEDGPLKGKKNVYFFDPFGHQLELVD